MTTGVSVLDPLADARWDDLLERHPRASVFHSRGWLEALKRTYGYEPIVADHDAARTAGEWSGVVPSQDLDVAPAGVAALLGSLRTARGPAGRSVGDARIHGDEMRRDAFGVRSSCGLDAPSSTAFTESASYYLHTSRISRDPQSRSSKAFTTPAPSGPFGVPSARA